MQETFETIHAILHQSEVTQRMDRSEVIGSFWEVILSLYKEPKNSQSREISLIHRLQQLIDEHYQSERYIDFYASKLHVTLSYLNECTRLILDKTVLQLISERLVAEAKHLLKNQPDLLTKELCFLLGFEDPTYFCRFFKKHTGHTPQKYKQLNLDIPG